MRRNFLTGKPLEGKSITDISWHGVDVNQPPDWHNPDTKILAFTLSGFEENEADIHVVMNMSDQKFTMQLPDIQGKKWCLAVDTSLKSPKDIIKPQDQKPLSKPHYHVDSRTITVFESLESHSGTYDQQSTNKPLEFISKITGLRFFDD